MAQVRLLTDWELSQSAFPYLPARLTQRRSQSRTEPVAPRSFSEIRPWQGFLGDAAAFAASRLDNQVPRNPDPLTTIDPLQPAADEVGVRVPLEAYLFPQTNRLANILGLQFRYKGGGSNRSFSYTDLVILDESQPHPLLGDRQQLSIRIFGNGEVKGPWQWDLAANESLEQAFAVTKNQKKLTEVIQQLLGDMVLDETKYGFITNYNKTVFFRRVSGHSKVLEFSPVVMIDDAPIEKFLYVLDLTELEQSLKPNFSRLLVKDTPPGGYRVLLPQVQGVTRSGRSSKRPIQTIQVHPRAGTKRKVVQKVVFYGEESLGQIPTFDMEDLGISGAVIAPGKFGNVIEGSVQGVKIALKLFDLRFEKASIALVREQIAYQRLEALQGTHVPLLLGVGRIPHSNVMFLALTDEGQDDVGKKLKGRRGMQVECQTLKALAHIHNLGVLHNDLKISHVKWNDGPKFIDFESSMVDATREELLLETSEMEALLDATREELLNETRAF